MDPKREYFFKWHCENLLTNDTCQDVNNVHLQMNNTISNFFFANTLKPYDAFLFTVDVSDKLTNK